MILQSLCDYYDRKAADLPPYGFEEKEIPFTILLNAQGQFIDLHENMIQEGDKLVKQSFRVPKAAGRSGAKSYETTYCLWDHYGYLLNQPKVDKPDAKPAAKAISDAQKQHDTFKNFVARLCKDLPQDKGVQAVNAFLQSPQEIEKVKAHERYVNCLKIKGCNLTFKLAGEPDLACQSPDVIGWVKNQPLTEGDFKQGICLISGEHTNIARLHSAVNGVNQKPAPLAAINDSAYNSFGKDKGFNFPIGVEAVFKYTTALNHLLRKNSTSKFRIADTTYICWAEKSSPLETAMPVFFTDNTDDPDAGVDVIKSKIDSIHTGARQGEEGKQRFYVLALAPNSARIMVRLWHVGTVAEFATNLVTWFDDIELIGQEQFGYPALRKLLRATALQYKDDNIPPNMPADVVRAILLGQRLPESFLNATIRRIKAEQGNVNYTRACIIKACLNRKFRQEKSQQQEIPMSLNVEETRPGYCLGRLFAVLEKLQKDAQGSVNATIRDRYYSSASSNPRSVFPILMRMSGHHLRKLESPVYKASADKNLTVILDLIEEFPAQLDIENQGLFALGYYHQKQAIYTKKSDQGE